MSVKKFYLKGAFDGDGHFQKKRFYITINVTDYDFLDEIKNIIKEVYNIEVRIVKQVAATETTKEQRRINFACGKDIYHELKTIIPKTYEEKIEYLKGLFDAEGSVGIYYSEFKRKLKTYTAIRKSLRISQKDCGKLDLWHDYLKELGIESNKVYRNDSRSELVIKKNKSMIKFYELIGFRIIRKQCILTNLIKTLGQSQLTHLEIQQAIMIYESTNFGSSSIAKMFYRTKSSMLANLKRYQINTNRPINRKITANDVKTAEEILNRKIPFELYKNRLQSFSSKGLKTFKIESIKHISSEVGVDLFTPDYNNFFINNGILSHNSTMAQQVGYYLAWRMAGGEMLDEEVEPGVWKITGIKKPTKTIRFGMENIVFSPEDLMKKAEKLYKKYGIGQVIIYDEGKSGLDSENAMKSINKAMGEFFQRCRVYHHIILVVLPNFFKLHEDYAVARSLFLIDVYADKEYNRGYFNFYNDLQKEKLFFFGKRLIGVRARYSSAKESFWGRFTKWMAVDKKEYDNAKLEAIKKFSLTRQEQKWKKQRDAAFYITQKRSGAKAGEIAKEMTVICNETISERNVQYAIALISHQKVEDIE